MQTMTSAYANKMLRSLEEDKAFWVNKEAASSTYVVAINEEPVVPEYDYADVAAAIAEIDENTLIGCNALTAVTIQNPECEIHDDEYTIPSTAAIYGHANSSAQASVSLTPSIIAYSKETRRPVASIYSRQASNNSAIGHRRLTGMVRDRIWSLGACREIESVRGICSSFRRRMPGTTPQVDREIWRIPMWTPPSSPSIRRNRTTWS